MTSLRPVVVPVLAVTIVCAVVALVVGGGASCLGALLGGVLVTVFLSATPAVLGPATRATTQLSMLIAMAFFGAKVTVLMVLLALFVTIDAISDHVDGTALGVTLLITSLVSTMLQVRQYTRTRIPTYDLDSDD